MCAFVTLNKKITYLLTYFFEDSVYIVGVTRGCVQREKGQEKFDIALQKLDEEDAADELLERLASADRTHFNYASVST